MVNQAALHDHSDDANVDSVVVYWVKDCFLKQILHNNKRQLNPATFVGSKHFAVNSNNYNRNRRILM